MPKKKDAQPTSLTAIYFGKDDAESDFAAGGLLQQGFLRTMAYEEALAGRKTLFVGRKGSGKSAICLMLHSSLSKLNRVALVTPDEISADEIRRFGLAGISPESSKELIWRYVFAVQIAKYLLTTSKENRTEALKRHVNSIRQFLIDNNEMEDLSTAGRFWKKIEKLKGKISFEAFSVKVGVEAEAQQQHASPGALATEQLDHLESHLKSAAAALGVDSRTPKFHLLVDQVEKVWSNEPQSNSMVIGLLVAAKRAGIVFPFVQCTVFLRTDIYEKVRFQEGDKFRTDEFRLVWDKKALLELALVRAKASSAVDLTEEDLWQGVFPQEMDSEKVPDFLVGMTLLRPRDIIQLCNSCRYTAQANGHETILPEDVKQAAKTFSTWKLNDIQNEWLVNYPFLPDVLLLLSNRTFLFTKASFASAISLISSDLTKRYPDFGPLLASAEAVLQILHSIGIIGTNRGGGTPIYNYQVASDQKLDPGDKEFTIHPAFRFALQSELAIGAAPFQFDGEFLQSRFRQGLRSPVDPYFDRHYMVRAMDSVMYRIDRLLVVVRNLGSEELRKALTRNVLSVQQQLETSYRTYDEQVLRLTIEQVLRYTSSLARTLNQNTVPIDGDVQFELNDLIRMLRDLLTGGGRERGAVAAGV